MSKKILVVEDDPSTARLIQGLLENKGYHVEIAKDGLDAMVDIKKFHPDLVVLDIIMPEINGYDVCYHLRFNEEFQRIPILIVSEEKQQIADTVGKKVNIEYLSKPVNPDELLRKVKLFFKDLPEISVS